MNGYDCYKAVLELMTEGCVITDSEGRHVFFNNAYVQLSGISAEYLKTYDVHQMLRKKIVTSALNPAVVKTGKVQKGTCVSRTGNTYVLTSYPLFGDDGKVQYVATLSRDISELERLRDEIQEQKRQLSAAGFGTAPAVDSFVVESPALQELMQKITYIADTPATVLLLGESGVGKSMFARRIHDMSGRRTKKFITVDCSCLPENLIEAELFGYAPGTFTGGSSKGKIGLIEAANGGTLFLDEIGELSPSTQAKLLRAIQEHEIRPVGSNRSVSIDVRFIAATHRNLAEDVKTGRFREDLFYRLSVIPLYLPPLRERREDLAALIGFFINRFNERYGRNVTQISPAAMNILYQQPWKGNIRELENVLERAFLLTEGDRLMPESLGNMAELVTCAAPTAGETPMADTPLSLSDAVRNAEIQALQQALALCNGNKTQAAELLGIGRRTLYDKLEQFGLMDRKG